MRKDDVLTNNAGIVNFMVVEITPPGIGSLGWKFYIIWTVFNAAFVPIVYFLYPETADRSLEDMDRYFHSVCVAPVLNYLVTDFCRTRRCWSSATRLRLVRSGRRSTLSMRSVSTGVTAASCLAVPALRRSGISTMRRAVALFIRPMLLLPKIRMKRVHRPRMERRRDCRGISKPLFLDIDSLEYIKDSSNGQITTCDTTFLFLPTTILKCFPSIPGNIPSLNASVNSSYAG